MRPVILLIVILFFSFPVLSLDLKYLGRSGDKYLIKNPSDYSLKKGMEGIFKTMQKYNGKFIELSIAKFKLHIIGENKSTVKIYEWGQGWNYKDIVFAVIEDLKLQNIKKIKEMTKKGISLFKEDKVKDSLKIFIKILKLDPRNKDALNWVNKLGSTTIDSGARSEGSLELLKMMNFPEEFKYLIKKATRVYLNSQGFWEAIIPPGITLVHISGGYFTMGSDNHSEDEEPVHKVFLNGFWIAKYEITSELFLNYYKESDNRNTQNDFYFKSKFPASNISWYDAENFCKWISKKSGLLFDLPTEAQWEKAARGSKDNRTYPWGWEEPEGNHNDLANLKGESDGSKYYSNVISYPNGASPYGVINMAGNASEWVRDWYNPDYYSYRVKNNPKGPKRGRSKVIRGGSYIDFDFSIRVSTRDKYDPAKGENFIGFRIVLKHRK